jgi:glycosyltransferase involved in cell wall biosynthesis
MSEKVSVVVVTYNSSEFILETLESVSSLTWKEIELIVTDDCSSDHTVELCRNWLSRNSSRFLSTRMITSDVNTGVSGNANRGLKAATGEWIKFMAGDDTFEPGFLADNMAHIAEHPGIRALFSRVNLYRDTFEKKNFVESVPGTILRDSIFWPGRTAGSQYRMLLVADRIHFTPSAFLHRETLLSVGGFDERFKSQEDYSLWLNLTRHGHKLHFMEKVTLNYRMHKDAQNNTGIPHLINPNYFREEQFRRVYTYPNMPVDVRLNARYTWLLSLLFKPERINKDHAVNRFLLALLTFYLNPFEVAVRAHKLMNRRLRSNEFYM